MIIHNGKKKGKENWGEKYIPPAILKASVVLRK
jgi:hypothetical protein